MVGHLGNTMVLHQTHSNSQKPVHLEDRLDAQRSDPSEGSSRKAKDRDSWTLWLSSLHFEDRGCCPLCTFRSVHIMNAERCGNPVCGLQVNLTVSVESSSWIAPCPIRPCSKFRGQPCYPQINCLHLNKHKRSHKHILCVLRYLHTKSFIFMTNRHEYVCVSIHMGV